MTDPAPQPWAAWPAVQLLLTPAATIWGSPITWLELLAAGLSLAMVVMNARVNPWGWPLAIAASALYALLFAHSRLYGEAALQGVFIAASLWGWQQWLRGRVDNGPLRVRHLGTAGWLGCLAALALLWPLIGGLLDRLTDSDVPYFDALPTAGSLIGQVLLARKWVENWPVWLAVNAVSVALFAYKGLWLTTALYAGFALMSVWGWRAWRRLAGPAP